MHVCPPLLPSCMSAPMHVYPPSTHTHIPTHVSPQHTHIKLLKLHDPTDSNLLSPPTHTHTHTQPTPLARPHRGPDDMYVVVVSSKDGIYRIRGRDPTKNKEVRVSSHKVLLHLCFVLQSTSALFVCFFVCLFVCLFVCCLFIQNKL